MIIFTVQAFESVRAWFTLFGFKIRGVDLKICFATPGKMPIMLNFVRSVAFNIL